MLTVHGLLLAARVALGLLVVTSLALPRRVDAAPPSFSLSTGFAGTLISGGVWGDCEGPCPDFPIWPVGVRISQDHFHLEVEFDPLRSIFDAIVRDPSFRLTHRVVGEVGDRVRLLIGGVVTTGSGKEVSYRNIGYSYAPVAEPTQFIAVGGKVGLESSVGNEGRWRLGFAVETKYFNEGLNWSSQRQGLLLEARFVVVVLLPPPPRPD